MSKQRPNVIFMFADQWRASAVGYNGDPNVKTPAIDQLKKESIDFAMTYSGCPICTPYRATLLTGQYPLTTGMFMNDVPLERREHCLGNVFSEAGYDTAYIGKWHIDGHGRSAFIPRERRCGFEYWKVLECTHDYMNSFYYEGDKKELKVWKGYDAYAQTEDAISYVKEHCIHHRETPFFMVLSLGTPHNPYEEAPEELLALYQERDLILPPNIPLHNRDEAKSRLRGYYAHISGIDRCVERLNNAIREQGIYDETVFVLTSDHGDCVMSHCEGGSVNKQIFYEESIHVPFLLRYPGVAAEGSEILTPFDSVDIFPTLVDLCGIPIPDSCEGKSFVPLIHRIGDVDQDSVLIASYSPFADWCTQKGGVEYRGIRTNRYTYVRTIKGEQYLFDNEEDPWQLHNKVYEEHMVDLVKQLKEKLCEMLIKRNDAFLPKEKLWEKYGYSVCPGKDEIPFDKTEDWFAKRKRNTHEQH